MPDSFWRLKRRRNAPSTPEAQKPTPEPSALPSLPLARKIHPNLNDLEAELEANSRKSVDVLASQPGSSSRSPRSLPVSPRSTRTRSFSNEEEKPLPSTDVSPLSNLPDSTLSLPSTAASTSAHDASPQISPDTRTERLITRLTKLKRGNSRKTPQLPVPPSAWSTFGRNNSNVPHVADFGINTPATSSRAASNGSHSNSRSHTPSHSTPRLDTATVEGFASSAPSSGFTFGHGFDVATPPPLPPLDHPAFNIFSRRDLVDVSTPPDMARQPRHSASLPAMSQGNQWAEGSTHRPRIQDIFPSTSAQRLSSSVRSRRSPVVRTAIRRRDQKKNDSGDGYGSVFGNIGRVIHSSQPTPGQGLGSPFSLQGGPDTSFSLSSIPTQDSLFDNSLSFKTPSDMAPSGNSHLFSGFESPPPAQSSVAGPSLLVPPNLTFTGATPDPSPVDPPRAPSTPKTEKSKGKRKAEEVEGGTPPDMKKEKGSQRATFSTHDPRPHRASATSGSSHAPSSYHRKRARISDNTFSDGPPSRMPSVGESPSRPASRTDTNGSFGRAGRRFGSQSRASSQPPRSPSSPLPPRSPSRRSLSQASIPISALISPHAPSVSHRSARFHMRDPRRPAPIRTTPWALSFPQAADGERSYFSGWTFRSGFSRLRGRGPSEKLHGEVGWIAGGGSPLHAWMFFFGFVVFPLWWIASFLAVPETRRLGGGDTEKGVVLDDPQVEFDSHSWRKRCRIMAAVSLVTYLPFIVLVAIFAP